jgi:mannitol-specific phosphotransferase system IIBC component
LPTGLGLAAFSVWEAGIQRGAWLQAVAGAALSVILGVFLAGPVFGYGMWRFDRWMQGRND